jgi:hypothetical protein
VLFAAHFTELADDQFLKALAWGIAALQDADDPRTRAKQQGCLPRLTVSSFFLLLLFLLSHTAAAKLLASSFSPLRFAWTTGRRSARDISVRLASCSRSPALADLTTKDKTWPLLALVDALGLLSASDWNILIFNPKFRIRILGSSH